jgi:membrane protein
VTVEGLDVQEPTWWATAVAIGAVLFTATTVLSTLQNALNRIFRVEREGSAASSIWRVLRDRILSVAMIVTVSFLLTVSFVVDAFLAQVGQFLAEWIGEGAALVVALDSFLLEFLATTVLFMLVFRVVPDVTLEWRDIRFGALLTAILFVVGKNLIASIIGQSNAADLYDAAGSILVLMLWVYYASALVLFGAIFTFTRARALGRVREGKGAGA